MKNILVFGICMILTTTISCCKSIPNGISYYDIKAQPVNIESNIPKAVILYRQGFCSECTRILCQYVSDICRSRNVKRLIFISASGTDPYSLRDNTDAVMGHLDYIGKTDSFQIVYDLNPKERQRAATRFHVKMYPALLLINANGHIEYIPYAKLFSDENNIISTEVLYHLADFAGVDLHLKKRQTE